MFRALTGKRKLISVTLAHKQTGLWDIGQRSAGQENGHCAAVKMFGRNHSDKFFGSRKQAESIVADPDIRDTSEYLSP